MNAPDEVETWWTRCVVIYSSPFESARAKVCKKSDTPHERAVFGPSCRARAFTRDRLKPDNRDRGLQGFRFAPSAGGAPERQVVTDRATEA